MVIAALVSFALLLAAWIVAPDRARRAPEPRITDLQPSEVVEPLAA